MTCIIGMVKDGVVYIGGDSLAAAGWESRVIPNSKVFHVGPFLLGCAGSVRAAQILRYHLKITPQGDAESDNEYMVIRFVEAIRACLKEYGFSQITSNREEAEGGSCLVGYKGSLYWLCSDYQITASQRQIDAIGSGETYALGAMLATPKLSPERRIMNALDIAGQLSIGVAAPYYVLTLPPPE